MSAITGKVTDAYTGKPIPGANIMVTNAFGTLNAGSTITDANGDYKLSPYDLQGKSHLMISHSGFSTVIGKFGWSTHSMDIKLYPINAQHKNAISNQPPPSTPWITNHLGYFVIGGVALAAFFIFK